jgi:hypothetical protein
VWRHHPTGAGNPVFVLVHCLTLYDRFTWPHAPGLAGRHNVGLSRLDRNQLSHVAEQLSCCVTP